ncbi:MAG: glycosyltransferase family 2 protein [Alphaproteobacteria bacterium]|nr:glycosyltransferase family 2 protein [Alphaproteobacteria bacterium]
MLDNIPATFEFPMVENPLVSIVVPVYNQYAYTHACLYSILKFTPETIPYEVVVLDDCSTDETSVMEHLIKNVTVYHNPMNMGFLKNCNTYIPTVRGKYVFLLNNDTQVTEGWLDPMLKALEKSDIGLTTSCILNPDGSIQAAGWTLMTNGISYPNALTASPELLKNKIFDVSYASGCAMCFEKSLWNDLGGFDELFLPAYCEDSDFSLRVRYNLKKRVVCVANSKIFHYGAISHGGKAAGIVEDNRAKFFNRWQKELEKDGVPESQIEQYTDKIWRWETVSFLGKPILKSYYNNHKKTYYWGKNKLFSRPFVAGNNTPQMLKNVMASFEFPAVENPLVSIVIPVYNQYAYTRACLYSILKFTPSTIPYEVIILDDCSTDETSVLEHLIKNVTVYHNQTNLGFLKNCNTYIPKARGEYIFLLNNDTQVTEGWLEPMLNALKDKSIGLATSCVLNIDGTIQAAGFLFDKTGIGNPAYKNMSPTLPISKQLDVHSAYGCAMFFEKSIWNKMGGFDEAFLPAYWEESDLCMRIQYQLKKRIVCVTDSKIFHYGGVSYHGSGQELFDRNKKNFYNRWQKEIQQDGLEEETRNQYLDDLWRWNVIRVCGRPILKSYYNNNRKTYYLGNTKLFSRPFVTNIDLKVLENALVSFKFPVFKKPLISIVIPVYNQYAYTHACLYSILKFTPITIPYEVIVLDDCSTDETQTITDRIKNITVYRNQTNLGFLGNCNAYIPKARGKYVFLLNNDTQVTEGWLDPVIDALKEPNVGATTSCVLNIPGAVSNLSDSNETDYTVQAAGLSFLKDGSLLGNYFGLPAKYLKDKKMDVQFVYGCAFAFKKSLWNKLGGFDEAFLPAYFEEVDFSMRVRYNLKKRIVCPANSKIFHYGMISYSGNGGKDLYKINYEKFYNRWQEQLDQTGFTETEKVKYLDDLWRWDIIRV